MNTKIKLLTLATGMYFFTGCNDSTTTTADQVDSTKMGNMKNDTMNNSMNMDNMKNGMMASMNSMMEKMGSVKMSGDFDMDFVNMMIEHHQGAIDMSEEELKSGADEKMKGMAQNIITSQKEEQSKLRDIVKNSKLMKMEMGKHDELTKGMEQMKAKMTTMQISGNTDKDFAMMMISHHESAVKMSKDELSHGMNSQLKQMATKTITDQTKEINEFKNWLLIK